MRRYIVTEEQLIQYREALEEWCRGTERDYLKVVKTSMNCRSRPLPDWATHFAGDPEDLKIVECWEFEEILK